MVQKVDCKRDGRTVGAPMVSMYSQGRARIGRRRAPDVLFVIFRAWLKRLRISLNSVRAERMKSGGIAAAQLFMTLQPASLGLESESWTVSIFCSRAVSKLMRI